VPGQSVPGGMVAPLKRPSVMAVLFVLWTCKSGSGASLGACIGRLWSSTADTWSVVRSRLSDRERHWLAERMAPQRLDDEGSEAR
jgi:hypothetical protein